MTAAARASGHIRFRTAMTPQPTAGLRHSTAATGQAGTRSPALHAHLAVVTRYRHGVLAGAMLSCYQAAMRKVRTDFGADLRASTATRPHPPSHGLASKAAVSALVNSLTLP